jgi:site-specific recombinase XerD
MDQFIQESKEEIKEMKSKEKPLFSFQKAVRGFLGYLEGTSKSKHTIKSYRLDLTAFENFLHQHFDKPSLHLGQLSMPLVLEYKGQLEADFLKSNTRRRQLLTLHQFFSFWVNRKKLDSCFAVPLLVPHKIEKVPSVLSFPHLKQSILFLAKEPFLSQRNRLLLWFLLETGCLVSEVALVKTEHLFVDEKTAFIRFQGKTGSRMVFIDLQLGKELKDFIEEKSFSSKLLFDGMNVSTGRNEGIGSRAIELIVHDMALVLSLPKLTPRLIRNTRILEWLKSEDNQDTIQQRLGLKTKYAFKAYASLLREKKP